MCNLRSEPNPESRIEGAKKEKEELDVLMDLFQYSSCHRKRTAESKGSFSLCQLQIPRYCTLSSLVGELFRASGPSPKILSIDLELPLLGP